MYAIRSYYGGLLLIPFGIWFKKDMAFSFPKFLEAVNLRGAKLV